jgi:hypothetical protein
MNTQRLNLFVPNSLYCGANAPLEGTTFSRMHRPLLRQHNVLAEGAPEHKHFIVAGSFFITVPQWARQNGMVQLVKPVVAEINAVPPVPNVPLVLVFLLLT